MVSIECWRLAHRWTAPKLSTLNLPGFNLCRGTGLPREPTVNAWNPGTTLALERRRSRQILQLLVDSRWLKVFGDASQICCRLINQLSAVRNKELHVESRADATKPANPRKTLLHVRRFPLSGTSACYENITQQVSIVARLSDKSQACVMTAPHRWISSCNTPWDQMEAMQTPPGLIISVCVCVCAFVFMICTNENDSVYGFARPYDCSWSTCVCTG